MAKWLSVSVDSWDSAEDEPLGSKDKSWVVDPLGQRWLFKFCRDQGGIVRGEDWAEWLVHHFATELGIPTAPVVPATWRSRRGILSKSIVASGERLVHGNELLAGFDPAYDVAANRRNLGYTIAAVRTVLDGVPAPSGWPDLANLDAFDVWAGYLTLDAWVAGRDRHHANWGLVTDGLERRLAPSFDHGNALGFQETSQDRLTTLTSSAAALRRWADRGTSPHFAGGPTLVAAANEALVMANPRARDLWLQRLSSVTSDTVEAIVADVPREVLSVLGATFCVQLLNLNQRRMTNGNPDR